MSIGFSKVARMADVKNIYSTYNCGYVDMDWNCTVSIPSKEHQRDIAKDLQLTVIMYSP